LSIAGNAPARAATPRARSIDWRKLAVHSEWLFAAVATAVIVYRHWVNLRDAGGLWRDEAHTAELAQLPTWSEIISNLQWDSFPILSTALLRAWCYLPGGSSDTGLRWFGMLIGVGILAGLWWLARRAHGGPPSIALLLWGMNPIAVRFADSVRPHGLGLFWMVLVWTAIAGLVPRSTAPRRSASPTSDVLAAGSPVERSPGWFRWLVTGLLAIAAVQTLYPNALVLAALLAAAAVAVMASRRVLRVLGLVLVGAVAAASLLPYIPSIQTASEWAAVSDAKEGGPLRDFWVMYEELVYPGPLFRVIYCLLPAILIGATVITWMSRRSPDAQARRFRSLYALLAGALGSAAYFVLIARSTFLPQPWHWLPVQLLGALAAEQILGGWRPLPAVRSLVLLVALFTSASVNQWFLSQLATNVDQAAAQLTAEARPNDLILIERWYWGVTFDRYYHGSAPWMTIPPREVINLHRYDLLQKQLQNREATVPIREKIAATLQAGGRVWLVGNLPRLTGRAPDFAEFKQEELNTSAHLVFWTYEVGYFLQQHEGRRRAVPLSGARPISLEEVTLNAAEGWRP
jgi:hypothetical protein